MNRITPEEVIEAYRVTGFRVVRGRFWIGPSEDDDRCGACAMNAVITARLVLAAGEQRAPLAAAEMRSMAEGIYAREYVSSFIIGFDNSVDTSDRALNLEQELRHAESDEEAGSVECQIAGLADGGQAYRSVMAANI